MLQNQKILTSFLLFNSGEKKEVFLGIKDFNERIEILRKTENLSFDVRLTSIER